MMCLASWNCRRESNIVKSWRDKRPREDPQDALARSYFSSSCNFIYNLGICIFVGSIDYMCCICI